MLFEAVRFKNLALLGFELEPEPIFLKNRTGFGFDRVIIFSITCPVGSHRRYNS